MIPTDIKPDYKSYPDWFEETFNLSLYDKPASIFEFTMSKVYKDFVNSDFWIELCHNLKNYNDEYYLAQDYHLLKTDAPPQLMSKTYSSVINKSFRKNIINNKFYPDPPDYGWVTPDNWFEKTNDLLRTTITVKYLDGVEFLEKKVRELAEKHNFIFDVDYEAREEGYYAAHITIKGKLNIVDEKWDEREILFPIEIQITTQLQEVIKGLLHKMYEEARVAHGAETEKKWQWDYKSLQFSSNYLGHILHYVEGMILEVRDKQKNK